MFFLAWLCVPHISVIKADGGLTERTVTQTPADTTVGNTWLSVAFSQHFLSARRRTQRRTHDGNKAEVVCVLLCWHVDDRR